MPCYLICLPKVWASSDDPREAPIRALDLNSVLLSILSLLRYRLCSFLLLLHVLNLRIAIAWTLCIVIPPLNDLCPTTRPLPRAPLHLSESFRLSTLRAHIASTGTTDGQGRGACRRLQKGEEIILRTMARTMSTTMPPSPLLHLVQCRQNGAALGMASMVRCFVVLCNSLGMLILTSYI